MASAKLGYFPILDIPEKTRNFADRARPEEEKNARRLLYVALTRARDRLILEWPDASVGKSVSKDDRSFIDLFIEESGLQIGADHVIIGQVKHPALITHGIDVVPGEFDIGVGVKWPDYIEYGSEGAAVETHQTPWRAQPSTLVADAPDLELSHVELGAAIQDASRVPATERGTAWHLALRVFLSDLAAEATRVQAATGLPINTIEALRDQAQHLRDWLAAQGYTKLHLELPIQMRSKTGAEMNAIIDCLAESKNGYLIIDHKTGAVADETERFAEYWPQLDAYRQLVKEVLPHRPVRGIAINWVSEGRMALSICHSGL